MSKEENELIQRQQELADLYGTAVYHTAHCVIRVRSVGQEVKVTVHRKIDRQEVLPNAYMLGSNYLSFKV